jgi:phage terminase large subunit
MKINKTYKQLKDIDNRILVLYGGGSSGKSHYIGQRAISRIATHNNYNWLVVRKVGRTLKNSVFNLLQSITNTNGYRQYMTINKTDKEFNCSNGNQIICTGLDDQEKIKSIVPKQGAFNVVWVEEATEITEEDFNQLLIRQRGGTGKKQIILTFNPILKSHWIYKRFFVNQKKEDVKIIKTTYVDNSFLTEDDIKTIESFKETSPYHWLVYGLGEWGVLGDLIYTNWDIEDLTGRIFDHNFYGLDFGFSNSKNAIVKTAIKDNTIYVYDEFYEKGLTNDQIADAIKKLNIKNYIWCDSAEPKSIKELRNYGIKAQPVKKGQDSVVHGIQWLQQKNIIIDKKCVNFINEIQGYQWFKDKDGNVLNKPIPINDHLMDAIRYAYNSMMKHSVIKTSGVSAGMMGL